MERPSFLGQYAGRGYPPGHGLRCGLAGNIEAAVDVGFRVGAECVKSLDHPQAVLVLVEQVVLGDSELQSLMLDKGTAGLGVTVDDRGVGAVDVGQLGVGEHMDDHILEKLLGNLGLEINEKTETAFHCNCDKVRVGKVLISLGEKELQQMIDEGNEIELNCHFCNTNYTFSVDELKELLTLAKK